MSVSAAVQKRSGQVPKCLYCRYRARRGEACASCADAVCGDRGWGRGEAPSSLVSLMPPGARRQTVISSSKCQVLPGQCSQTPGGSRGYRHGRVHRRVCPRVPAGLHPLLPAGGRAGAVTVTSLPPPHRPLEIPAPSHLAALSDGNGLRFLINRLKFRVGSLAGEGCLPAPRTALRRLPHTASSLSSCGAGAGWGAAVLPYWKTSPRWLGGPVGPALEAVPLEQMAVKLWRRDKLGLTA